MAKKLSKAKMKRVERQVKRLKGKPGINPWALARHQVKTGQRAGYKRKAGAKRKKR